MPLKTLLAAACLALASLSSAFAADAADADFSACRQFFAGARLPVLPARAMRPRALCYDNFAVLHSGTSRTPIYVAERLNKDQLALKIERGSRFFADARLPRAERSELADYKRSGFDRGHMAPAADMVSDASMAQSFSLANMVPQASINNRKPWAGIEQATRRYASRAQGDVYVITGPVFDAKPPTIGANRVWVPQHLFKLVYDPATQRAWAHWIDNTDAARAGAPISYAELVRRTGVEWLPVRQQLELPLSSSRLTQ
ncbi:DNA/RNA non-specific endonuclease [Actimicrobium sp. CCC2.4]|uniref:DNA/RNA non-specific endonuclease n=1 Tax=Actimicrobium sp. CCC2.4 TaxID=3048606 RepID=UPI002AC8A394|nr:DNA/RNA non-specific endonuclease [Actimicrobium sp. CCC2.4]MEB0135332.1 DNA/RNA non-specific endonuclease [Actimicrobium sp. CCC2.4]WPX31121.1 DNA/RNA non-specific endonuclease [Actimicrobium sp. CCC2.4]